MVLAVHHIKSQGFTLIEVMIVVVIVAIIAGIALPSYQNHVCKTERQQLKMDLLAYGQAMDKLYNTNNFSYLLANSALPNVYSNYSPADAPAGSKKFDISLTVPDSSSYNLSAQRSGGNCQDGVMALSNTGAKTWTRNGSTQSNWNE